MRWDNAPFSIGIVRHHCAPVENDDSFCFLGRPSTAFVHDMLSAPQCAGTMRSSPRVSSVTIVSRLKMMIHFVFNLL
jgi:hypothetical protein